MPRPQKRGLDYFALDVNMNDEVEIIEAKHGLEGFAILIKLFQKIYSEGYYYSWGDKEQILFSSRVSVDRNKVASIVNDCIQWDIFSQEKYEKFNVLTSRRIQNQYISSTYKRTNVEVIKEYLLIDVSDKNNLEIISITDNNNHDVSVVSDDKSTQSKEKETKVKETKVEDLKEKTEENILLQIGNLRQRYSGNDLTIIDNYLDILRWTRKNGKIADSVLLKIYQEWEKFAISKVIYALKVYINNPSYHDKKENYCYGIMRNSTAEDVENKKSKLEEIKSIYPEL